MAMLGVVIVVMLVAFLVPLISVSPTCNGAFLCYPYERDSLTFHFLGFGMMSTYNGQYYELCLPFWCHWFG